MPNVADVLDEHTSRSDIGVFKAQATLAMKLLISLMLPFEDIIKDLTFVHRANTSCEKRTEIWTERAFAAGELMFSQCP